MSTPDAAARLGELARAATPGPWYVGEQLDEPYGTGRIGSSGDYPETAIVGATGELIVSAYNSHCCSFPISVDVSDADAAYIAAANPSVILALLERTAELEAALLHLVDDVEGWERGKGERRPGNEYTVQPSYLRARAALAGEAEPA